MKAQDENLKLLQQLPSASAVLISIFSFLFQLKNPRDWKFTLSEQAPKKGRILTPTRKDKNMKK